MENENKHWILVLDDEGKDWRVLPDERPVFLIRVNGEALKSIANGANPFEVARECKQIMAITADGDEILMHNDHCESDSTDKVKNLPS